MTLFFVGRLGCHRGLPGAIFNPSLTFTSSDRCPAFEGGGIDRELGLEKERPFAVRRRHVGTWRPTTTGASLGVAGLVEQWRFRLLAARRSSRPARPFVASVCRPRSAPSLDVLTDILAVDWSRFAGLGLNCETWEVRERGSTRLFLLLPPPPLSSTGGCLGLLSCTTRSKRYLG
jgi:hypothetical protein